MAGASSHPVRDMAKNKQSVLRYATRFRGLSKTREGEHTRTCTAKQILEASAGKKHGGRFVLDNKELYTVRLCGRIISIEQNENETNYTIDDGTGAVNGRIWSLNSRGHTGLSGAMLGAYYVIIANVVTVQDGILLQTLQAYPVKDHNEVTMHLLTAIYEHCATASLAVSDVERWGKAEMDAKESINKNLKLELDKEAVVSFLSDELIRASNDGASSECIIKALQMEFQEGWATLQTMIEEGSIYNTIDYHHFKLADEN